MGPDSKESLFKRMAVTSGPNNHFYEGMSDFSICATHIFNCHFHKYIPQLHPDSNKVTCLKLGLHIPEWPNFSLSGVNQLRFSIDKRHRREEGSKAKEFVNSSGEKGQTKNLLWAAVRARFFSMLRGCC